MHAYCLIFTKMVECLVCL